jgi:hypothetical protein
MRRKLQTKRRRQRYARHMETMEPVFGPTKQGGGFRQFLLPGLDKGNEGQRRMVAELHRPQPAQAVPQQLGIGQSSTAVSANDASNPTAQLQLPQIANPQTVCQGGRC